MITLKGIAWDHPRGYQPLRACSHEFSKKHPRIQVKWDIRTLKEFGDLPVEELIDIYDLITIDHPYMGQAHAKQLLIPLQNKLPASFLEEMSQQSVGLSYQSYFYRDHLYALPIDAAALVAASRDDLLSELKLSLPRSREELFDYYKSLPTKYKVAWPLCPTDLWCTFLTLCAQDAGRKFINNRTIDEDVGCRVLNELKRHLKYLHPESLNWNPIHILDHMGNNNEIIYSPFLFGYSNYSREGYNKNIVTFRNSPSNPHTDVSTILGGVGLAISAMCTHTDIAVDFVKYTADSITQEGVYTKNGGQPGNLIAWQSQENNKLCNNFFTNTLESLQKAYVRPQHEGWNQFQEQGAELLHQSLVKNTSTSNTIKDLNKLYQSTH